MITDTMNTNTRAICMTAPLTISISTATPAAILCFRMCAGKEGSLTPVIGLRSTCCALAANSGRGRS
ncbi:unnamed protein product [Ixodes pacificus]